MHGPQETTNMRNVKLDYDKKSKKLTIVCDLSAKGELSSSGKTELIASTQGNVPVADGSVKLGLNIMRPIPKG
jgi:hypothetical protein